MSIDACFRGFGFLGIEEAGRIIENPFGNDASDLPLHTYVANIEADVIMMCKLAHEARQNELAMDPYAEPPHSQ